MLVQTSPKLPVPQVQASPCTVPNVLVLQLFTCPHGSEVEHEHLPCAAPKALADPSMHWLCMGPNVSAHLSLLAAAISFLDGRIRARSPSKIWVQQQQHHACTLSMARCAWLEARRSCTNWC